MERERQDEERDEMREMFLHEDLLSREKSSPAHGVICAALFELSENL